jgi:hypothetical protein
MQHEHQHPQVNCGFKSNTELANLLGWSESEVKTNFDKIMARSGLIVTKYDPASIMHYQLPAEYFTAREQSKCYILSRNVTLSPGDISFLQLVYPKK